MKKMGRWLRAAAMLLTVALWLGTAAWADGGAQIISSTVRDEEGVIYLDPDGDYEQIAVQVGQTVCQDVEVTALSELETPLETVILVDNSLSVPAEMRELTRALLTDLVGSRMDREKISIGTVEDGVSWLCEGTSDYAALKTAVEQLEYYNQETYLTGAIYETIAGVSDGESDVLHRLVVIADGENAASLGYTWGEVEQLARAAGWPVYAVVLTSDAGEKTQVLEETAENLFALARATGGAAFSAAEGLDSLEIAAQITQINQALRVSFPLPAELCDGMERAVEVSITRDSGESERVTVQMTMPMRAADSASETADTQDETSDNASETADTQDETADSASETADTQDETSDSASELAQQMLAAERQETPSWLWGAMVVVAVLLAVGIIAAVFVGRKPAAAGSRPGSVPGPAPASPNPAPAPYEEKETVLSAGNAPRRILLIDCQQPERRFDLSLDQPISVGRGSTKTVNLHGEERVSRDQCVIIRQGARVILQNHSRQGTRVEGKLLYGPEQCELTDGCIVTMGEVLSFRVELR